MEMERNEKDKHVEMEEKVNAGNQHLPWISQALEFVGINRKNILVIRKIKN